MIVRRRVLRSLIRKDVIRLLRNGPALMMLGLMVVVAFVTASSGLVEESVDEPAPKQARAESWIVYWQDSPWVQFLKRRAPDELAIRFVEASSTEANTYPPNVPIIELRPPVFDKGRQQPRRHVRYRHPGSDPNVLWPVTRWFLSASIEHFGEMPPLFETVEPLQPPSTATRTQAALESTSVADVLSVPLIGTALLMMIQFFSACGLFVSLTAQERERGAVRALLLTPMTYFEFVSSKAIVHGALSVGTSVVAIAALRPAALTSPLLWGTMLVMTCGYFAVGLLISSFAKNQAAPNLLSFGYLLLIGLLNLMAHRFESFRFLSGLSFERYGLQFTIASELQSLASLRLLWTPGFLAFAILTAGLLLIATYVNRWKLTRDA